MGPDRLGPRQVVTLPRPLRQAVGHKAIQGPTAPGRFGPASGQFGLGHRTGTGSQDGHDPAPGLAVSSGPWLTAAPGGMAIARTTRRAPRAAGHQGAALTARGAGSA